MPDIVSELSVTIDNKERNRRRFRIYKIVLTVPVFLPILLIVTIIPLAMKQFNPLILIWTIIIYTVIFGLILLTENTEEHEMVEINAKGLYVFRGSKSIFYDWNDIASIRRIETYNGSRAPSTSQLQLKLRSSLSQDSKTDLIPLLSLPLAEVEAKLKIALDTWGRKDR